MIFDKESDFEEAVIDVLVERGWEPEVIRHPTEADLLKNWADILFNNNRQRNCLNECPLTDGEMQQIMEQVINLRTPLRLNSFINGRSVSIIRDNPDDELHFGKEVSLISQQSRSRPLTACRELISVCWYQRLTSRSARDTLSGTT